MDVLIFIIRLLLTAAVYAFLVAVFVVLWRDLRAAAQAPAAIQERKARLTVLGSCDGLAVGAALTLQPFTTVGRSATNTIVVPDTFASADHAIISWRGGQWWLEDLGSRNGTQINDIVVTAPIVLGAGDVISIGQVKLKMEFEG